MVVSLPPTLSRSHTETNNSLARGDHIRRGDLKRRGCVSRHLSSANKRPGSLVKLEHIGKPLEFGELVGALLNLENHEKTVFGTWEYFKHLGKTFDIWSNHGNPLKVRIPCKLLKSYESGNTLSTWEIVETLSSGKLFTYCRSLENLMGPCNLGENVLI